jgi:regulator of protease activity HflC (stomatin/prohibitin superfamily)
MFDRLISLITDLWEQIVPWYIIHQYDGGVRLRFGKFHKVLEPGLTYKIPFIDEIISHHVVWTTMDLPPQSLTTTDERNIVVTAVVKYRVADIKTFLLEVYDATDAISDMSQAVVKRAIMTKSWEECKSEKLDNELAIKARVEAKKWGIEIVTITLTNVSCIKSIRLFNESTMHHST